MNLQILQINYKVCDMSYWDPFIEFLKNAPTHVKAIELSLRQIEIILRRELPRSAYTYPTYWHDQARPHVSRWKETGWNASIHSEEGRIKWVTFGRIL